jgi:hypothetical protein
MRIFPILIILCTSISVFAAQKAVVMTDGAMVYKGKSFESPVIGYLRQGKKVMISNKVYGPFYRIRLKQGVVGYISDVDVVPAKKYKALKEKQERDEPQTKKPQKRRKQAREAFLSRFYIGPTAGYLSYSEVIAKQSYSGGVMAYGLKTAFPVGFLDGPFVGEVNALFSFSAPDYYKKVSETPATGFIGITDFSILYKMSEFSGGSSVLYLGAGPMVNYSRFVVEIDEQKFDLEEVRLGLATSIGFFMQLGPMGLRLEPRIYIEKSTYFAALASLLIGF